MKDNSNISQDLLETVEAYHNQTMSAVERQNFEQRLQNDGEFKTSVEHIESLLLGIEQQALREKLDAFHEDMPIKMPTAKKKYKLLQYQFMKIAAAAVIVIAVGCFWFLSGSSNERLYDAYFKPDPGLPTTMSSTDNYVFYDAMVNYKQGDYESAIAKWEVLQKKQPENDTLNYFLGVANLANNHETTAIPYLEKTVSQSESFFINDANYYLGLAYLKMDDKVNAVKFLKLSGTEKSKKLLKKLD